MNRTEDILNRLKGRQPAVSNPDALTDSIMDNLPLTPKPLGVRTIGAVIRIVLAMAAVWLIGVFLFVNQHVEQQQNTNGAIIRTSHESRSETLKRMYAARQQKCKYNQLSYTQLKRIIYENR